jgi:hypothetical protein
MACFLFSLHKRRPMKHLYILGAALLLMIAPAMAQTAWRIEPGDYLGKTKIGAPTEEMATLLGPADGGDAAMGKSWGIWYSHKKDNSIDSSRYLAVYSVREETNGKEAMIVKQVRVNSPSFKTAKGLKVGSSYIEVKKQFPAIKVVAQYQDKLKGRKITLYDVKKEGIAFEMTTAKGSKQVCTAITIHPEGESINTYILFPGYEGFEKL